ncbi:MAG: 2'-5' RNA ligase family protein [Anaerolineaceae bacterium]|nr:2'-5' RNA ligase family protein [Anaerolineaceae bacterium]
MNHAVELYFDESATRQINIVREHLAASGVPIDAGTRPHISLALYEDLNQQKLIRQVSSFAKRPCDLNLSLGSVGIFPSNESVIFFTPKVTPELLTFHATFLQFMQSYHPNLIPYYDVPRWVPHCTLGIHLNAEELTTAVRVLKELAPLPIQAGITHIGVLAFPPNTEVFSTPFSME